MDGQHVLRHVIVALLWGIAIFALALYQFPADRRLTTFFINKALGQTAIILIGLSFLLGPLCKIFHLLSHHIRYRKYFGLLGFATVLLHIVTSLLQISDRFPLQWYLDHALGITAAIVATVIFFILAVTSKEYFIHKLGGHPWKIIQRTGYIALFLTLVHVYVVASPRWEQWFKGDVAMPTSFLIFAFGYLVLVARILALVIDRIKPHPNPPPQQPS